MKPRTVRGVLFLVVVLALLSVVVARRVRQETVSEEIPRAVWDKG